MRYQGVGHILNSEKESKHPEQLRKAKKPANQSHTQKKKHQTCKFLLQLCQTVTPCVQEWYAQYIYCIELSNAMCSGDTMYSKDRPYTSTKIHLLNFQRRYQRTRNRMQTTTQGKMPANQPITHPGKAAPGMTSYTNLLGSNSMCSKIGHSRYNCIELSNCMCSKGRRYTSTKIHLLNRERRYQRIHHNRMQNNDRMQGQKPDNQSHIQRRKEKGPGMRIPIDRPVRQ